MSFDQFLIGLGLNNQFLIYVIGGVFFLILLDVLFSFIFGIFSNLFSGWR